MVKSVSSILSLIAICNSGGTSLFPNCSSISLCRIVFDITIQEKRCNSGLTIPTIRSSALLRINSSLSSRHCKIISLKHKNHHITIIKAFSYTEIPNMCSEPATLRYKQPYRKKSTVLL